MQHISSSLSLPFYFMLVLSSLNSYSAYPKSKMNCLCSCGKCFLIRLPFTLLFNSLLQGVILGGHRGQFDQVTLSITVSKRTLRTFSRRRKRHPETPTLNTHTCPPLCTRSRQIFLQACRR